MFCSNCGGELETNTVSFENRARKPSNIIRLFFYFIFILFIITIYNALQQFNSEPANELESSEHEIELLAHPELMIRSWWNNR